MWAVVCSGYENGTVFSVNVFDDFESAQDFMREDAQTEAEANEDYSVSDFDDEIIFSEGGVDVFHYTAIAVSED